MGADEQFKIFVWIFVAVIGLAAAAISVYDDFRGPKGPVR